MVGILERGSAFTHLQYRLAEVNWRVFKVRFHQGRDNHLETHAYRQGQVEVR